MNTSLPHRVHVTPNRAPRTEPVRYIILHATEMEKDTEALSWWCDPAREISCHYFIDKTGALHRLVDEAEVAWHAGKSVWHGEEGLNRCSLGIEISNPGQASGVPFHEEQYKTLEALLTDLMARHNISPENVLGHADIAPGRKVDPGPHFDWARLVSRGLAKRG